MALPGSREEARERPPLPQATVAAPERPVAERQQPPSRGLPEGAAPARSARTIVVDPGHGGPESGAVRTLEDGKVLREKDLTLKVALATAELLREAGQRVILTRTGDQAVNAEGRDLTGDGKVTVSDDLQARIDVANAARADLFVSIHFNAGKAGMRGTEVFYNANRPHSEENRRLAAAIYIRLVEAIKASGYDVAERGVKKDSQATGGPPFFLLGPQGGVIVRASQMPAALGEGLFLSHPTEAELLESDEFLLGLARAYARGILDYLDGKG